MWLQWCGVVWCGETEVATILNPLMVVAENPYKVIYMTMHLFFKAVHKV